jgi:hypothetical protein
LISATFVAGESAPVTEDSAGSSAEVRYQFEVQS